MNVHQLNRLRRADVSARLEIFVDDEDVSFRHLIFVIICHVTHLAIHHYTHTRTHTIIETRTDRQTDTRRRKSWTIS